MQSIVATLVRSYSYYRELTVETFWEGGSSSVPVQVWVDGGWSHSRQVLPSGAVRHDLTGDAAQYYWYEGSQRYETAAADGFSADLSQRLPTYETVLLLDPEQITAAGYELRGGMSCVWVEVQLDENLSEQYWVSVDSGLLVSAEMVQDGPVGLPDDGLLRHPDPLPDRRLISAARRHHPAYCLLILVLGAAAGRSLLPFLFFRTRGRSAFPLCPQGPSAAPDPAR